MCLLRRCPQDSRVRTEPAVECEGAGEEGRGSRSLGSYWEDSLPGPGDAASAPALIPMKRKKEACLKGAPLPSDRVCETLPPSGPARKDQGLEGATWCPVVVTSVFLLTVGSSLAVTGAGTHWQP